MLTTSCNTTLLISRLGIRRIHVVDYLDDYFLTPLFISQLYIRYQFETARTLTNYSFRSYRYSYLCVAHTDRLLRFSIIYCHIDAENKLRQPLTRYRRLEFFKRVILMDWRRPQISKYGREFNIYYHRLVA